MADQSGRHARRECSARGGKWHLGCFVVSAGIFQHGTCRLLLQLDIRNYIVELEIWCGVTIGLTSPHSPMYAQSERLCPLLLELSDRKRERLEVEN
jgi:hypothetical protein